ncbi:hypothetical protein JCM10212_002065 [Sporobolomyces blumeae]
MPKRPHLAVKLARALSPVELAAKLASSYSIRSTKDAALALERDGVKTRIELYRLRTLPAGRKEWIWDLFERNMKHLYEASRDGWDPTEKRKELFDAESRFVVLRPSHPSVSERAGDNADLAGYAIFRFDTEDTADEGEGDGLCDVVYCYELQVEQTCRGRGHGKLLMDCLERIADETRMVKTILTVFKANDAARTFYRGIGFSLDEIDPSRFEEDVDYEILSKRTSR